MADSFLGDRSLSLDGFWGTVVSDIQASAREVVTDVLPDWVRKQVGVGGPGTAYPNPSQTTMSNLTPQQIEQATATQPAGFVADELNVDFSPGTVIAAGLVLIGVILLFKVT